MSISFYAIPAFLALAAKAIIYLYARQSRTRGQLTRLFLWFLLALAIQNVAEIALFTAHARGLAQPIGGTLYFAAGVLALPLLLHIALKLSLAWPGKAWQKRFTPLLYLPALLFQPALWLTPWIITGFESASYGYIETRGPGYIAFEAYVAGYMLAVLGLLVYGSRHGEHSWKRVKNRMMLLGLLPPVLLVLAVLALQRMDIYLFNATATLPLAVTFFIAFTAYTVHRHRLFDIEFYIPGSGLRKRKTEFYARIRQMIAEIADLPTVRDAVEKLADTLNCPVALVSTDQPVVAVAGNAQHMAHIPRKILDSAAGIMVANELVETQPDTSRTMQRYGIAAIVPFNPSSRQGAGWLLLGESFGEQVYTDMDFRLAEQLFDKMADLFLDKLLQVKHELASTRRELDESHKREREARLKVNELSEENAVLKSMNERLSASQLADSISLVEAGGSQQLFKGTLTVLGRDKAMRTLLRDIYPQTNGYTGPDSTSFRRQPVPDIHVCHMPQDMPIPLARNYSKLIQERHRDSAFLLYGNGVHDFLANHAEGLIGSLTEILVDTADEELLQRKIDALYHLRRATRDTTDSDWPLVVADHIMNAVCDQAKVLAKLPDNLVVVTDDMDEALTVARYIHQQRQQDDPFIIVRDTETLLIQAEKLTNNKAATIVLFQREIDTHKGRSALSTIGGKNNVKLIVVCNTNARPVVTGKMLTLPSFQQRRQDIQYLAHYYTLQFNLAANRINGLSQNDLAQILKTIQPINRRTLRDAIMSRLGATLARDPYEIQPDFKLTNKTLDEYVAQFESQLIRQTLERCQGNKSQAARLLGLRPNTLHYKLERYGLSGVGKPAKT